MATSSSLHRSIAKQRFALLISIDRAMAKPIAVLGFAWLALIGYLDRLHRRFRHPPACCAA